MVSVYTYIMYIPWLEGTWLLNDDGVGDRLPSGLKLQVMLFILVHFHSHAYSCGQWIQVSKYAKYPSC